MQTWSLEMIPEQGMHHILLQPPLPCLLYPLEHYHQRKQPSTVEKNQLNVSNICHMYNSQVKEERS